jgi:ABC-type Fe3+-hydroxamate transport system substrate-binding protein
MHQNKAKIVCLVPSWTETLLEAGLNVVGRTRFCIHPAEKVKSIAVVGGTKNMNLAEIRALAPDYVILDKEENKKEMAEALLANGIEVLVSHVVDIASAADFLKKMADVFNCAELDNYADLYRVIKKNKALISRDRFLEKIILQSNSKLDLLNLDYVIWREPFMVVGANTFIADVFSLIDVTFLRDPKYPQVSESELKERYCFFSSEPYPFAKDFYGLTEEGYKGALVDGEKISWYGIRSLAFLGECLK